MIVPFFSGYLSGTEPKPHNNLNGGEIVIAGDSQTKRGTQPYTFDVSKEGSNDVSYWVYSTVGDTSEKGQTHVKIDKSAPKAACDVKSSPTFGEFCMYPIIVTPPLSSPCGFVFCSSPEHISRCKMIRN